MGKTYSVNLDCSERLDCVDVYRYLEFINHKKEKFELIKKEIKNKLISKKVYTILKKDEEKLKRLIPLKENIKEIETIANSFFRNHSQDVMNSLIENFEGNFYHIYGVGENKIKIVGSKTQTFETKETPNFFAKKIINDTLYFSCVAVCSGFNKIILFSLATNSKEFIKEIEFSTKAEKINLTCNVIFSFQNELLLSLSKHESNTLRVYNKAGKEVREIKAQNSFTYHSHYEDSLITYQEKGLAQAFALEDGKTIKEFKDEESRELLIGLAHKGKVFATVSGEKAGLIVFDWRSCRKIKFIPNPEARFQRPLLLWNDYYLITSNSNRSTVVYNIKTYKLEANYSLEKDIILWYDKPQNSQMLLALYAVENDDDFSTSNYGFEKINF